MIPSNLSQLTWHQVLLGRSFGPHTDFIFLNLVKRLKSHPLFDHGHWIWLKSHRNIYQIEVPTPPTLNYWDCWSLAIAFHNYNSIRGPTWYGLSYFEFTNKDTCWNQKWTCIFLLFGIFNMFKTSVICSLWAWPVLKKWWEMCYMLLCFTLCMDTGLLSFDESFLF